MDLMMPVQGGIEATERIFREVDRNYWPTMILALTASGSTETKRKCLEVGMKDVLCKPVKALEITAAIRKHISLT